VLQNENIPLVNKVLLFPKVSEKQLPYIIENLEGRLMVRNM
jgi:hypothetical protein